MVLTAVCAAATAPAPHAGASRVAGDGPSGIRKRASLPSSVAPAVSHNCPNPSSSAQFNAPSIPSGGKTIALTFDDGPGPSTASIVSILESFRVRATFFNVGQQVAERPGDVVAEESDGFLVGNHTWNHADLMTLSSSGRAAELDQASAAQRAVTGTGPCVFRPPYGDYNAAIVSLAGSRRMSTWLWNVDPEDWKADGSGSSYWVNRIISIAESEGSRLDHPVVILHNQAIPMPATVAALPTIIRYFQARGYTFVDLLGRSGPLAGCGSGPPASLPATFVSAPTTLAAGDSVRSPGNQYEVLMQSDGNLVEYTQGRAVWASATSGNPGARAVMQSDGNLVVYASDGSALWSSRTSGHPGATLRLRTDGDLRVVSGTAVLWSSHTGNAELRPGEYLRAGWYIWASGSACRLVLTNRGNLVLRSQSGVPIWQSGRHAGSGDRVVMQTDGNLVMYTSAGAVWASATSGRLGSVLNVSRDGTVFLAQPSGNVPWFR